ncbi:hypothetical protein N7471_009145 [Penicillium samsonianum]|uniref:uncharacterized protein n=1 Tax=Penicillium samsonianum TaxID=1882272 RepID=UPI0025492972|nr:uncharacterized protein N7471_009145 [Penicillium samsonianum]KAJ6127928.1 hypothetical protein N7471_009145 [Penicillium samsonianum]
MTLQRWKRSHIMIQINFERKYCGATRLWHFDIGAYSFGEVNSAAEVIGTAEILFRKNTLGYKRVSHFWAFERQVPGIADQRVGVYFLDEGGYEIVPKGEQDDSKLLFDFYTLNVWGK